MNDTTEENEVSETSRRVKAAAMILGGRATWQEWADTASKAVDAADSADDHVRVPAGIAKEVGELLLVAGTVDLDRGAVLDLWRRFNGLPPEEELAPYAAFGAETQDFGEAEELATLEEVGDAIEY